MFLFAAACGFTHGIAAKDGASGSGGDAGSDAGSADAPTDGKIFMDAPSGYCLGDATITVCLATMPTGNKDFTSVTAIDTGAGSPDCANNVVSANAATVCVVAGGEISILNLVSASGSRPLVLMSSSTITVNNTIDVASHISGTPQSKGPGADPTCAGSVVPTGGVGGFGGSFGTSGGNGGGDNNSGTGGTPATTDPNPSALRGGCQGGTGANTGGAGGHGGGALALLAATQITLNNPIDASGAGGRGATTNNTSGGGGGGAGGMIVIDAPLLIIGGPQIYANGGGGGEGRAGNNGNNGSDPSDPTTAASGGSGGGTGGNGGDGSVGAGSGSSGNTGNNGGGGPGGGGGGGGGAGVIQIFKVSSAAGATFSPPPSFK